VETAGFVEEQRPPPALPLLVRTSSEPRVEPPAGDCRFVEEQRSRPALPLLVRWERVAFDQRHHARIRA
jgi:hypothetical protein